MRVLSMYCPTCADNRMVHCVPEGRTACREIPGRTLVNLTLHCPEGHPIARVGAVGGPDVVLDMLIEHEERERCDAKPTTG